MAALGAIAAPAAFAQTARPRDFKISLAAWSLHRMVGSKPGQISLLDLPRYARETLGIEALELVSYAFQGGDKAFSEMKPWLKTLSKNAEAQGVKILLVMVDGQGEIGSVDEAKRLDAVERHKKWIDVTHYLGGHSMRMNWTGAPETVVEDPVALRAFVERSVPGFHALCEYGEKRDTNVIIENHGGASSRPEALVQLIESVDHPRMGTLPDFGNFPPAVDRYMAIDLMMNYAHAVSAKCYDFDPNTGDETKLDYARLIDIVTLKHGYHGYIGIEFEGDRLSEKDGVLACKALLERLRDKA